MPNGITTDDYWNILQGQHGNGGLMGDKPIPSGSFSPAGMPQPMSDRQVDALASFGSGLGLEAGAKGLAALGMGATTPQAIGAGLGSVVSPATAIGAITSPAYAQAGLKPESNWASYASMGLPIGLGVLGGPIGGLMGGVLADPAATAIQDYTGSRAYDEMRDKYLESMPGLPGELAGYRSWAEATEGMDPDSISKSESRYGSLSPEKASDLAAYDVELAASPADKYAAAQALSMFDRLQSADREARGMDYESPYAGRRATFSTTNPGGLTAQELSMRQQVSPIGYGLMNPYAGMTAGESARSLGRSRSQGGTGVGARGTGVGGTGLSGGASRGKSGSGKDSDKD